MNFYTNVFQRGNAILVRHVKNGVREQKKVWFKPTIYVEDKSGKPTTARSLQGKYLSPVPLENNSDYHNFIKRYKDTPSFKMYSGGDPIQQYINQTYPMEEIEYDADLIRVAYLDIEVDSKGGFADNNIANKIITSITVKYKKTRYVFGYFPYTAKDKFTTYIQCRDEHELLSHFVKVWIEIDPDVVTGWNVNGFDIPYLVRRLEQVHGPSSSNSLSPWKQIKERRFQSRYSNGQDQVQFDLVGISTLDYFELYKKFTYSARESYTLDYICSYELDEQKVDYSEYGSLNDLYEQNFEKFIDYNIRDVDLVEKLDDKLKMIELVYAMAYDARSNFVDTFTSVRFWEIIIAKYLTSHRIIPPVKTSTEQTERRLVGAFVKPPKVGMSKWVMSFDLDSLYPSLIMQYNISPEMILDNPRKLRSAIEQHIKTDKPVKQLERFDSQQLDQICQTIDDVIQYRSNGDFSNTLEQILDQTLDLQGLSLINSSMTANGLLFNRSKQGFLPTLMDKMFNDRKVYKAKLLEAKKQYQQTKDPELLKQISKYDNFQMAKKICLNSAYGSLSNQHFLYYDIRFAEAITVSGQLTLRWIVKRLNKFFNQYLETEGEDYVIAGDTDSIYLCLDRWVQAKLPNEKDHFVISKQLQMFADQVIKKELSDSYQQLADYINAYQQRMNMKLECIADKGIWTGKKRYCLNVYHQEGVDFETPKLKMMGIEAIKSSTPAVCRDSIKKTLELIMTTDENQVQQFIELFRQQFFDMSFEQIGFPRGVNNIDKYGPNAEGAPWHSKAAIVFNNALKKFKLEDQYLPIYERDKIKIVYMTQPNPFSAKYIACKTEIPKQFQIDLYIDYKTQFRKAFVQPIQSILSVIGWNHQPVSTLDAFFAEPFGDYTEDDLDLEEDDYGDGE